MKTKQKDYSKLKIEKRRSQDSDGYWETRYFAQRIGRFDGTANGYGYKSLQALYRCYAFCMSDKPFGKKIEKSDEEIDDDFHEYKINLENRKGKR
ncbi:MAG: hypothetical protein K2X29_05425 [Candidatus Obscuribacterales bacterium]|nr:hypothetical protein [Candidatus Obscuribacterales bacterium]